MHLTCQKVCEATTRGVLVSDAVRDGLGVPCACPWRGVMCLKCQGAFSGSVSVWCMSASKPRCVQ
eukprot:scaffold229481_cov19-Tisochrysis_lutea.AAC.1